MLKIRLSLLGTKHKPFYRIVVAEARSKRNGQSKDCLGYYDPKTNPPTIKVDHQKLSHWQSVGAQPTPAVIKLLKQNPPSKD